MAPLMVVQALAESKHATLSDIKVTVKGACISGGVRVVVCDV